MFCAQFLSEQCIVTLNVGLKPKFALGCIFLADLLPIGTFAISIYTRNVMEKLFRNFLYDFISPQIMNVVYSVLRISGLTVGD